MVEWKEYRIKDLGEVVTGNTPPTSNREYYGTEYKFIKPTDMVEGQRFVSTTEEYYSELAYQKYKKCLLPPKTPCVVTIGSLGKKMCLTDTECFTNQAVNAVIPNKENDGEFLYYAFKASVLAYVKQLDSGTTSGRENVSKSRVSKIKVRVPPLPTQQKIASILSAYDNLIQNYKKQIEALQTAASELYKEWFVRFRFPGYQTAEFENGIPEGWKIERIGNIGEVIGGGTPSTENEEYWDGDIPWLSPVDLSDNTNVYVSRGGKNITKLGLQKSSAKMMPKDTVLLSSRAPVGYVALAKNPICTNQGFKSVVCNTSVIQPIYLYFYFRMNKNYLQSIASGATFPELSGSMMKKLKVLLPQMELQKEFSKKANIFISKAELLSEQITNLTQQRDLLLPRLMRGALEVH